MKKKLAIGCGTAAGLFMVISVVLALVGQTPRDQEEPKGEDQPSAQVQKSAGSREPADPIEAGSEEKEDAGPPPPVEVELISARGEGDIEVSAGGSGSLDAVRLTITSNSDDRLEVVILPGTVFESQAAGVASMVATRDKMQLLEPHETVGPFGVDAASTDMELDTPGRNDILTLSPSLAATNLTTLLKSSDFKDHPFRVQQFAIWTITGNPGRDQYTGIATGFSLYGSGPSDEEIESIRVLFERAGIPTEGYLVFARPVYVELVEAKSRGIIEVGASGESSIDRIQVSLTSRSDDVLEVAILPGTLFEPQVAGVQSMVVILKKVLLLYPRETVGPISLDAACANMELDVPAESDSLSLSLTPAGDDLMKLLRLADFQDATLRVKQFAIWTITDNPARDQYAPIGTRFDMFGKGPSDEEIEDVRSLFERAGIPMDTYQALRQE